MTIKKIIEDYNKRAKFIYNNEDILETAHTFGLMCSPTEFTGIENIISDIIFEFYYLEDKDIENIRELLNKYSVIEQDYTIIVDNEFYNKIGGYVVE